ncbi:hypothetical protein Mnod_5110 [Methylobacterium nodulans ORS 2060]|uniref:Uncharacterized protein n=1 Tax=Methylobacterium nodulans (strain LMG 21967 / CNCM I-2342 / ORS 2060) TaxID=460265 RepID=B8IJU3_METNO|nr:hypothetical protein Mnod_5110 [Methylobacterium nodulans ORS 2060]
MEYPGWGRHCRRSGETVDATAAEIAARTALVVQSRNRPAQAAEPHMATGRRISLAGSAGT